MVENLIPAAMRCDHVDAADAFDGIHERLASIMVALEGVANRQQHVENLLNGRVTAPLKLLEMSPHFNRNVLPNDSAVAQKALIAGWQAMTTMPLAQMELAASGLRVFSQHDEDGLLLRMFAHAGTTNRVVIEIGSNCDDSDIGMPQNLSANLIVNHGWHGVIFEKEAQACDKLTYFFARNPATAHFHWESDDGPGYFSPRIVCAEVTPQNVESTIEAVIDEPEPDLLVLDIDGPDFRVAQSLLHIRPRVLVVEFEKRLRPQDSVIQPDHADINRHWSQSGTASLAAWDRLLGRKGYVLCAIAGSGFNAFYVRADVAAGKLSPITPAQAFASHPVLRNVPPAFWRSPDETWVGFE